MLITRICLPFAEPDEKSEGFMDGALDGFPNLKSFGGFDAMPDTVREGIDMRTNKREKS